MLSTAKIIITFFTAFAILSQSGHFCVPQTKAAAPDCQENRHSTSNSIVDQPFSSASLPICCLNHNQDVNQVFLINQQNLVSEYNNPYDNQIFIDDSRIPTSIYHSPPQPIPNYPQQILSSILKKE